MRIPDSLNKLKIRLRNDAKKIARSHWKPKDVFLHFGAEEVFFKKIENDIKQNINHPINKQNIWKYGRTYLAMLRAEKEATHIIKTLSREEVEQFIIRNIKQNKVSVKDLPIKAQSYYTRIVQSQNKQTNSLSKNPTVDTIKNQATSNKNAKPKIDKPLSRLDVINTMYESLELFNENVDQEFNAVYVKMKDNRKRMEKQWEEKIVTDTSDFNKIYYQDLLKKAQLFKAKNRINPKKIQSLENDLEL